MEYLIAGAVCAAGLVIPAVLGMTSPHRRRRSAPPGRWIGAALGRRVLDGSRRRTPV